MRSGTFYSIPKQMPCRYEDNWGSLVGRQPGITRTMWLALFHLIRNIALLLIPLILLLIVGCSTVEQRWNKASSDDSVEAYEKFLKEDPNSKFSSQAKVRLRDLQWKSAQTSDSLSAYREFLGKYPTSKYTNRAFTRSVELLKKQPVSPEDEDFYVTLLSKSPLFATSPERWVILETLECIETEDWFADECLLQIFVDEEVGSLYERSMDDGDVWELDKHFKFYDKVEVKLWDEDSPDPDDFLGIVNIGTGLITHAQGFFLLDGAHYRLWYSVTDGPTDAACRSIVEQREANIEMYTEAELGSRTRDLLPSIPSQGWYCVDGNFSLEPHWYGNRVKPQALRQSPVDLQAALGATPTTPDLVVLNCIADELFLKEGSVVSYKVNSGYTVTHFLDNPGSHSADRSEEGVAYVYGRNNVPILAIEKDIYGDRNILANHFNRLEQFSGTIIFADKITVAEEVQTGGYDLVLVANHLEFCPNGLINTTPPPRPAGPIGRGMTGVGYDYGYAKEGYSGGDVIIFAKNIIGEINIITTGGVGQKGRDGFPIDIGMLKWKSRILEYHPTREEREAYGAVGEDPDFRWFVEHHLFDIGEQGRGGRGGRGGNVNIVSTTQSPPVVDTDQQGGKGSESAITHPPISEHFFAYQFGENQPGRGSLIGPEPFICRPAVFPAYLYFEGTRDCTARQPYPHPCDQIYNLVDMAPYLFFCMHKHTQLDNVNDPYLPADAVYYGVTPWPGLPATAIEQNWDGIIDPHRPPSEMVVYGKTGPDGPNGIYGFYRVAVPYNLLPFEEAVTTFVTETYDENLLDTSPDDVISNHDFAQLQYSLAPRAAEILISKADNLFRALSDEVLMENDSTYVDDSMRNPLSINRIDKARYLYAAAAFFAVDMIEYNIPETEAAANPYWPDCQYAIAQKRKMEAGLNFFGFEPGFFLYVKPHTVHGYLPVIRDHLVARRNVFESTVVELYNAIVDREEEAVVDIDQQLELEEMRKFVQVADAEMQSAMTRLEHSISRIDENSQLIDGYRSQIEPILSEIDELTQPPPCDFLCWVGKVFNIASAIGGLVSDILSFDWGEAIGVFRNIGEAFEALDTAANFLELTKAFVAYSNLLINGKAGTVKFEIAPGLEGEIINDNTAFKKGVIDRAKGVYENAEKLKKAHKDITSVGGNPFAEKIAGIRASSENISANIQDNLTQIYALQASVANISNPRASALARSLEDVVKGIQSLNREIPELQRQHIEAAADLVIMEIKREYAQSKVMRSEKKRDLHNELMVWYNNRVSNAEIMIEVLCGQVNSLNDHFLLMKYLYQSSKDYLTLVPERDMHYNINALKEDEWWRDIVQEDVRDVMDQFVMDSLHQAPQDQPNVVTAVITPVQYEVSLDVNAGFQFRERTRDEIAEALCPGRNEPCSFTKAAYYEEILTNLREFGVVSFEIYPSSLNGFQALPDSAKRAWNPGFTSADEARHKKRVVDVAARILLQGYTLSEEALEVVSRIRISHDPWATFKMDETGTLKGFHFGQEPIKSACRSIEEITGSDYDCEAIEYFTRFIVSSFDEIESTYLDLNTITVEEFGEKGMYGTSLRGVWTIDITEILAQLELIGPQAIQDFWNAFRGIQFKVFSVSLP